MKISKTYAHRETAIRNIHKGKSFSQKIFARCWNDKESFVHGVVQKPHILDYDTKHEKFKAWWTDWRHDEDFVLDLFNQVLHNGTSWITNVFPSAILDSLTDSQIRIPQINDLIFDYLLDTDFSDRSNPVEPISDQDRAVYMPDQRAIEIPMTKTMELFMKDPYVAIRMLEDGVIKPSSIPFRLRMVNRDIAKLLIAGWGMKAGTPFSLRDDIDFIIECAESGDPSSSPIFTKMCMSDRLRRIVGEKDIVTTLKAYKLSCELTQSLAEKSNVKHNKPLKI